MHISFNVDKSDKSKKYKMVKMWYGYSPELLRTWLNKWSDEWEMIKNENLEIKMQWFFEHLCATANKFVVEKKVKQYNEFFDSELEKMRQKKNMLHRAARFSDEPTAWNDFRTYRSEYKQLTQRKKYEWMQSKLNAVKGDAKKTWKVLNSILKDSNHDFEYILSNGEVFENSICIANEFNKYFTNAPVKISNEIPYEEYTNEIRYEVHNIFEFSTITLDEVKHMLCQCHKKQNRDCMNINVQFLIDGFDVIGVMLTDIINLSFSTGIFPPMLKESIIVPIQKVNGTKKIEEYRPINTLPCVEKVLEKVAYKQLCIFFEDNNIICMEQSGFRSGHSCESALNYVIDDWKNALGNQESIITVFLDFQKAFETIERSLLINKLRMYGLGQTPIRWMLSYLNDRTQRVKINNKLSDALLNNIGVPQGSVLGPLLFIIYINDLKNCLLHCRIKSFADDTLIYIRAKNIEENIGKMNADLERIYNRINQNKLKLNVQKTKLMIITNKKSIIKNNINIKINNVRLDIVEQVKYLGVIIDEDLNFKQNCDYVTRKMAHKTSILRRVGKKLNMQQKIYVYKSIIEAHLNYCSTILFLSNETEIQRIQIIQNRCMRNILRVDRIYSNAQLLTTLEFLNVKQIITLNSMISLYKIINNLLPQYLCNKIRMNNENERKRTLRNRNEIEVDRRRGQKKFTQNSLFFKGINIYNKTPDSIKNLENTKNFKCELRKYVYTNL